MHTTLIHAGANRAFLSRYARERIAREESVTRAPPLKTLVPSRTAFLPDERILIAWLAYTGSD